MKKHDQKKHFIINLCTTEYMTGIEILTERIIAVALTLPVRHRRHMHLESTKDHEIN